MDILRRNTDYALRAMANLAAGFGKQPVSARALAETEDIPYQLACKLLQRLQNCGFVAGTMGPKGGFALMKKPRRINLLEVIECIQGPLKLNRCLLGVDRCPRQRDCRISSKLAGLQQEIDKYLGGIKLDDLVVSRSQTAPKRKPKRSRRTNER